MGCLRVALAQINVTVGDVDGNSRKIRDGIDVAKEAAADIVVFPELAVCGYPPEDLLLKPRFLTDCREATEAIARNGSGITAVVGFPEEDADKAYNAAAIMADGGIVDVYRKIELPNYGVFDEERYFGTGAASAKVVFDAAGTEVCVNICEDIWQEGGLAEWHVRESRARVVLNLSGSPYHAGKPKVRHEVLARFARRTATTICYVNLVGGQDELVFDGGSVVVGPQGDVLCQALRFRDDMLVVDVDLESGVATKVAGGNGIPETHRDKAEDVYEALVLGTHDYVRKNGFEKVLVGLSGGIDSALTAAVAVAALGADNVVGVTMPSQYTSDGTLSDAGQLARNLGIELVTVPIEPVFAAYADILKEPEGLTVDGDVMDGIAGENVQARIRGNVLMALSNRFGWLVLAAGNKSEISVGYCTLYGDMAGGFAVIKDVPKTLVYKIAHHVNGREGREVIPESTLERAPTAELRPGQKDSDSLPPYPVLDEILRLYVEEDAALDEIVAAGFDPQIVDYVVRMVDRNEYKRRQAPPGVKITPKAFGRDRRLPMTSQYRQTRADAE